MHYNRLGPVFSFSCLSPPSVQAEADEMKKLLETSASARISSARHEHLPDGSIGAAGCLESAGSEV
jgi:hypothetical protein